MSLVINLTPAEEALLSAAAEQARLTPEALAEKFVREQLPGAASSDDGLDAKLRQWQAQDQTKLLPTRTVAELFAQWDKEAAQMTEEELEAEDRLWEDVQLVLA